MIDIDEIYEFSGTLKAYNDETDKDYNHLKCIEELLELAEVLMKKTLKRGGVKEPTDQSIVEEIGDVIIRLYVLSHVYDKDDQLVLIRIEDKLNKFKEYIQSGKYKRI